MNKVLSTSQAFKNNSEKHTPELKIALVALPYEEGPQRIMPLGLQNISAYIKKSIKQKKTITIFDYSNLESSNIEQLDDLILWKPDLIGISIYSSHVCAAIHWGHTIQQSLPESFIFCGGPHISSTPYILAFDQGHALTLVFEQFPLRARHYNNIAKGAHALFKRAVATLNTPFYAELLEYEDAQNVHALPGAMYTTEQPKKGHSIIVPYDLESFYTSLLFYGRASAPAFLYQQLAPEPGTTYKILSR